MVKISECKKCTHNAVCSYYEDFDKSVRKAIDELDHGFIILEVKCFFYEERK